MWIKKNTSKKQVSIILNLRFSKSKKSKIKIIMKNRTLTIKLKKVLPDIRHNQTTHRQNLQTQFHCHL